MAYTVEISPAAARELRKLPSKVREVLLRRIRDLRQDPRPADAKQLSAPTTLWRFREAEYRVIYQIRDDVLHVLVVRAGHRRDVYRQLPRLAKSLAE